MTLNEKDNDALYLFINEIDYNKELFGFINAKVDPNTKPVWKGPKSVTNSQHNRFFIDKKKASIIVCIAPKCGASCIQTEHSPLICLFMNHLWEIHGLTHSRELVHKLANTINCIRNNKSIRYTDHFVHIEHENLIRSEGK